MSLSKQYKASIKIYDENSYYFAYNDKPVLLLGGSDEDNLFNFPDMMINLDALHAAGGNYIHAHCHHETRETFGPMRRFTASMI